MHSRRAFTLIELLVVVAIIVALLAILLPSMSGAIRAAEIAICGSNQKQVASAQLAYAADNAGTLPVLVGSNGSINLYAWHWQVTEPFVDRYLSHQYEVLYCPTFLAQNNVTDYGAAPTDADGNPTSSAAYWYVGRMHSASSRVVTSYFSMNADFVDPATSSFWILDGKNLRTRRLTDPGTRTMLADNQLRRDSLQWIDWTRSHFVNAEHPDGSNTTLLDNSVKWKSFDELEMKYSYNFGNRDLFW